MRPLQSAWHPFIAGDGLGYYAYLPAVFIYHDTDLQFEWFNKTYNNNYVYSSFKNPQDNILVKYKHKLINKYYQGLSFIWLPFFFAAHACAKILNYPADGFSLPYQYWIGLASLFYLLLGLFYLRKLLDTIFQNQKVACIVPMFIFYGTHLFNYSIFANSLSHVYSFTFNILFVYFVQQTFQANNQLQRNVVLSFFFYLITVCIRPLNALIILVVPVFMNFKSFHLSDLYKKPRAFNIIVLAGCLLLLIYQCSLMFIQTHSIIPYTYTDEHFNFLNNQFIDSLFSYHNGLLVYVPLFSFSFLGIFKVWNKKLVLLPILFLGILFLYSAWWYWPITKRAMLDFYFVPAILLAALLVNIKKPSILILTGVLMLTSVFYYQLKSYQVQKGILDEFASYKDIFWRNFFRTKKANMYLVPPNSILKSEYHVFNFEEATKWRTEEKVFEGKGALLTNSENYFCQVAELNYPKLFNAPQFKKIRFSMNCLFEDGINKTHLFIQFFNKQHQSILDVPFYLNKEDIFANQWDFKEFGYELSDSSQINAHLVDKIGFTIWNVDGKSRLFIDNLKIEFILTNMSYETIK